MQNVREFAIMDFLTRILEKESKSMYSIFFIDSGRFPE